MMSRIFDFSPALIVFDKDGTLIDFNFMWTSWVTELARRLERAANLALAPQLYAAMGYDAARVTPRGIAKGRLLGLETTVYTVNDERRMIELRELGVSGIFTDYPGRALAALGRPPAG